MTDDALDAFDRPADAAAAQQAVAAARPGATPVAADHIGRGNRKRTVAVRFSSEPPLVVQVSDDAAALRSEATLLAAIRQRTDVPVPSVVASGTADGVGYLVTPLVEGADLHERFVALEAERQRAVARSFGRYLGTLHEAFAFDGHGPLAVADGSLVAAGEPWPDWLGAYGRRAVDRLPAAFDSLRPALESLLADPPVDSSPPARLFPWDLRPGNALLSDGEVAAVLDWEAPLAADPALSAAKAEYLVAEWYVPDPAPLRAAFVAGYGSVRPYPDPDPVHRVAAVADSAVDSRGVVTNPGYPEADREDAIAFHRRALEAAL